MLMKSGFGQLGGTLLSTTRVPATAGTGTLKQRQTDDSMATRRSFIGASSLKLVNGANAVRLRNLTPIATAGLPHCKQVPTSTFQCNPFVAGKQVGSSSPRGRSRADAPPRARRNPGGKPRALA